MSILVTGGAGYIGSHTCIEPGSYKHLRAPETKGNLVCRLLLEKKNSLLAR